MLNQSIYIWLYDRKRKRIQQITLTLPTTTRDRMKKKRATFANFIHQKMDASIACIVVMMCIYKEIPIYTVHDNFLTNALNARELPAIYTDAFINQSLAWILYIY